MITVWVAAFPAMFYGMYNVGLQANTAMLNMGIDPLTVNNWHVSLIALFAGFDPNSIWDNMIHGAAYFLPVYRYLRGRYCLGNDLCRCAWP
jgi:Na+-transporting NADH:ubiquinone oxidoreductase subunit B